MSQTFFFYGLVYLCDSTEIILIFLLLLKEHVVTPMVITCITHIDIHAYVHAYTECGTHVNGCFYHTF